MSEQQITNSPLCLFVNIHRLEKITVESRCTRLFQKSGKQARLPNKKITQAVFFGQKKVWRRIAEAAFQLAQNGVTVFIANGQRKIELVIQPSNRESDAVWYWLDDRLDDPTIRKIYKSWYSQQIIKIYREAPRRRMSPYEFLRTYRSLIEERYRKKSSIPFSKVRVACYQSLDLLLRDVMTHVGLDDGRASSRSLRKHIVQLVYPKALSLLFQHVKFSDGTIDVDAAVHQCLQQRFRMTTLGILLKLKYTLEENLYGLPER